MWWAQVSALCRGGGEMLGARGGCWGWIPGGGAQEERGSRMPACGGHRSAHGAGVLLGCFWGFGGARGARDGHFLVSMLCG
jgi:hypothetical protein